MRLLIKEVGLVNRLPWRDKPLAVICRSNKKSGKAVARLRAEGFSRILLVDDGMIGWQRHGFATETGNAHVREAQP